MSQKLSAIPAGVVTLSPSDLMYVAVDAGGGVFTKGRMPVSVIDARFEAALGYVAANVANPLSQFAATTSAQLAAVISDETGSGLAVFNDTPTFITPNLGVASATSVLADTLDATVSIAAPTITGSSVLFTFLSGGTMSGTTLALSDAITITQLSANTKIFSTTGYSLTGASAVNMFDLAGTWNTSGSPTAIKLNITNTASGAAALLFDLQASTVSQFSVSPTGAVVTGSLTLATDLTVPNGGTGASSFTDGGVLIGNAAGAIQVTAVGTAGQVLTSNGPGVDPTFQAAAGASPPFIDSTALVMGSADPSKLLRFEVDGFTAATTRVLTPPNQDATIAGLQVAETFSAVQTFTPSADLSGVIINHSSTAAGPDSSGLTVTSISDNESVQTGGIIVNRREDPDLGGWYLQGRFWNGSGYDVKLTLKQDGGAIFTEAVMGTQITTSISLNTTALNVSTLATFTRAAIGVTPTDSVLLKNLTAAAAGAQQISPAIRLTGQGWRTSATAESRPTDWRIYNVPIQGVTDPLSDLKFDFSVNAGAFSTQLTLNSTGLLTTKAITMATASVFSVLSGTNTRAGNAVLVAGTVTVANTTVTANTLVLLTRKTAGGTLGTAITYTVSAATSFTITSDSALDTSTFSYFLIERP